MKLMYFVSPYDLLNKRTRSPHPMTVEGTLVEIFVRIDKILNREFFLKNTKYLIRKFSLEKKSILMKYGREK